MDSVARLIVVLLFVLLPGLARAVDSVPPAPVRTYTAGTCLGNSVTGSSGMVLAKVTADFLVCQGGTTTYNGCPVRAIYSGSYQWTRDVAPNYMYARFIGTRRYVNNGSTVEPCASTNITSPYVDDTDSGIGRFVDEMGCEQGSHMVGTTVQACACDSGYMLQGGKCKQYTCPPSGSYSAVTQPDQKVANAGDGQCSGGCGYTPSSWKVGQDGQIWATWPFKSTGKFCGGDPSNAVPPVDSGEKNSKNPAPVACGTNQCPGTVNGQAICVPCKGQQEQGPSTSASSPTGGASAPGNGSSSTTTECNGVTCTTTTTTRDGAGTVTGTAEKTEKQESFCKENPESNLCKKSSFGGQCASTTCEGDAIMCAIAADQMKRNCQWFDDDAAQGLRESGNTAMSGVAQPDGHPAKSPDAVPVAFSSAIDQSDAIGGGNCPSDVSFSLDVPLVGARTLNVGLSQVCQPLQIVGQVGVAIALLWAGLFVFRGVS